MSYIIELSDMDIKIILRALQEYGHNINYANEALNVWTILHNQAGVQLPVVWPPVILEHA